MKHLLPALALAGGLAATSAITTSAQADVELGTLTCELTDVTNVIVYTNEEFSCVFEPSEGDADFYTGEIDSFGVNLQFKEDMTIIWVVIAPTTDAYKPGILEGTYVGGSAEVSIGAGMGAKVLVGGGENSFTLQPVSVSGIVGAGAQLGIESFVLDYPE